jgi:hypothetical protein
MKNSTLIKTVLIAASLPLLAGCVERQVVYRDRPVYVQQPAPDGTVVADEAPAPPAPQKEYITIAPGPLDVWFWVPGCWEWHDHWVWIGGHWSARPHPGAIWIHAHWSSHGHHRVWVSGYWR